MPHFEQEKSIEGASSLTSAATYDGGCLGGSNRASRRRTVALSKSWSNDVSPARRLTDVSLQRDTRLDRKVGNASCVDPLRRSSIRPARDRRFVRANVLDMPATVQLWFATVSEHPCMYSKTINISCLNRRGAPR